jgi:hypothetical protein
MESNLTSASLPGSSHRPLRQIPVSLGKASLRVRLEAYYSLIAPDTLSNRSEWLVKFDQIYEKVRLIEKIPTILLLLDQDVNLNCPFAHIHSTAEHTKGNESWPPSWRKSTVPMLDCCWPNRWSSSSSSIPLRGKSLAMDFEVKSGINQETIKAEVAI